MTNLEAKEKLYNEWQKFLEDNIDYAGISEAYKMAFKALDQEVCGDAISRQAVLDVTICDGISCKECAFFTNTLSDCLLYERIKRLPPVNPQIKTDILDKLTEIIEPLRHLSFDEMSDIEWQILQVIDKYEETTTKNDVPENNVEKIEPLIRDNGIKNELNRDKDELEQEPCEDAISRVSAINAVSEALEHVFVKHEDIAKKMINKLPSVKPQELCEDAISRQAAIEALQEVSEHYTEKGREWHPHVNFMVDAIKGLSPVTPKPTKPKTAHWVYKIYGGFHEQGDWYCSKCDYPFNYGYGHAEYCPKCGCEMSETPTEEVIGDRDYDWVTRK